MKKHLIITFFMGLFFCVFFSNNTKAEESVKVYEGELGPSYSTTSTMFKVWSSSASKIEVVVEGTVNGSGLLEKDNNTNVWIGYVQGDLNGSEYSFNIEYEDGTAYENVLDPYGKYVNESKTRNVIYNDTVGSFDEWQTVANNLSVKHKNKIIYGINVETFTQSQNWNGPEVYKGKLGGLIQTETRYNNYMTGFDYVKNLGVTYVELGNLNDSTNNFSVNLDYVNGTLGYSGNEELKKVVYEYRLSGMGIIGAFDFVNFSDDVIENFQKIDREYYDSGSFLSKQMIKKYIIDLIEYWTKEYKLSGIKLANMSMYDVVFVNDVVENLMQVNNNLIVYGDGSYNQLDVNKAGESNLSKINGIGMLNGSLNYALLGDVNSKNINGLLGGEYNENIVETLKFALLNTVDNGEIDYSLVEGVSYKNFWGNSSSFQIINYLGTRNGLSLYDKLFINNLTGDKIIEQKAIVAFGTLLMNGGIPYIEAGTEFLASYQSFTNDEDSICTETATFCFYKTGNKKVLDWAIAYDNSSIVDAFKSLVNFRKKDTSVIQTNMSSIKNNVNIFVGEEGNIGYVRKYPNAYVNEIKKVLVLFNYSNNDYTIDNFGGKGWSGAYHYNLSSRDGSVINMKANSIYIASQVEPPKVNQWVMLAIVLVVIAGLYYLNISLNKKLVENKGYDIKSINKKYRPFINKKKLKSNRADNVEDSEKEKKEEDK